MTRTPFAGFLPAFLLSAALAAASHAGAQSAPSPLTPGSAHYSIQQGGKTLGDAQYAVGTVPGGYTIASSGHMALGKFSYSFRNQSTLDSSLNLVRDTLTGSVNGNKVHGSDISVTTASDSTGRELAINTTAEGKQTTSTVDRHRNTVLVPDLDPGAYLLLARLAMLNPDTAWVLIPKENGLLVPTAYKAQPDVRGTLSGSPVPVKHSTAELSDTNSLTLELYYSPEGELLEADLNAQNFYVVRDGFKLLQHPAPTPPPPGQAPPPQPGQEQGQPGQPQA